MKYNHSIVLSLLFVATPQSSWSMQPEADPQNQDIIEEFLTARNSEIIKLQNRDSITYQISKPNAQLFIGHVINTDDYYGAHYYTENDAKDVPNPKKIFDVLAQKFELQQNQELRAAIQPGYAYWIAVKAANDAEDWVDISKNNI